MIGEVSPEEMQDLRQHLESEGVPGETRGMDRRRQRQITRFDCFASIDGVAALGQISGC